MTRIYLHIGIRKTGSTSVQNFLFENRETLLNHGILYPLSGRGKGIYVNRSHNNLCWALNKCGAYDPNAGNWETLYKEIHSNSSKFNLDKVIISAEGFSTFDYDLISLLRDHLSEYEVKIIVYLRRQDDYFESMYQQSIKGGHLKNDIRNFIQEEKNSGIRADFYQMLEPWKELFGKQNIFVRVFEKEQLRGGSLYDDFLFNIDPGLAMKRERWNYIHRQNVKPNLKVIKVMQLLNKVFSKNDKNRWRLKRLYEAKVLKRPDSLIASVISKVPDFLITPEVLTIEEKINLMKEFEESNQKVAREYLGRPDGKLFSSTLE